MSVTALPKRSFQLKALLFFTLLTLGVGFLGGLIGGASGFEELNKPPLTPPAAVFPVVWTILYIMMGAAAGAAALSVTIAFQCPVAAAFFQIAVADVRVFLAPDPDCARIPCSDRL